MAKRLDSPYEPGKRSACWVKVKNIERQEFVIGGWVPGEGRRTERIGALLLGVQEDADLRYAGRVGTGFTEGELERLAGAARSATARRVALRRRPKLPREAVFVEPRLVAEVEFREWTPDGMLRAPSYKGLRDDKPPELVVREESAKAAWLEVEGREVKLSNPGKVLYPGGRVHQARPRGLLRRDGAGPAAPPARPPAHAQALSRRGGGRALLREAVAVAPAGLGADGVRSQRAAQAHRLHAGQRSAHPGLAGEPGGPRVPHPAAPRADARAADRPRVRPGPGAAGDDRGVLPRGDVAARHVRQPRHRGVRQDARDPRACRSTSRSTAMPATTRRRPSRARSPSCWSRPSPASWSHA